MTVNQRTMNTNVQKSPAAFTGGIYLPQFAGAPPVKAGLLWGHDYTRADCFVEGTAIVDRVAFNNLFEEIGAPNNGQVRIAGGSPITYVDQSGTGFASGFQQNGGSGNLLQLEADAGTDFLQTGLTDDFLFTTSDVFPNTSALDGGGELISKISTATTNNGTGLLISRLHGQTSGSAAALSIRCSDTTGATLDYVNASVLAAGSGQGFHSYAVARIGGSLRIYQDGVLIGTATPSVGTFSAVSAPLARSSRVGGGTTFQIVGLKMISDMGIDLTLAAAAIGGITTTALADQLVAQLWAYEHGMYGAYV